MARVKLMYVKSYLDRHGKVRHYFRRRGYPQVSLPGVPGSPEFMEAYRLASGGERVTPHEVNERFGKRTFGALVASYFQTVAFTKLKPSTKATYRHVLDVFVGEHGKRSVSGMDAVRLEFIIAEIGKTRPAMANLTKAVLSKVLAHAVKLRWRADNAASGIEKFKGGTLHTWTDEELAQFERRWPVGTRERLAYALCLYTDQRVSDVVKFRRSDMTAVAQRGGPPIKMLRLPGQEKTNTPLMIPIHPALQRALDAYPAKGLTLIGSPHGRPLTGDGLGQLIERAAEAAGLRVGPEVPKAQRCVPHGLRKAMQRRLAERGATDKQLQAMSGHKSLSETQRYTQAANQARLAQQAMALIEDDESA